MTLELGILLALACAFATNLAFLYKHRGACAAPTVDMRHPLASGRSLFASRWFAIGMLVAFGAWYVQFRLFRTNGLLWSLAVCSLAVPLIDRLLPGSRYAWPSPKSTAPAKLAA